MASCCYPDIFSWIQKLPPLSQWKENSMSTCLCSSSSQPSLNLSVIKNLLSPTVSFSIVADFNLPISLWTSKPIKTNPRSSNLLDDETISCLLVNLIEAVLSYCSNKCRSSIKVPKLLDSVPNFKHIFNLVSFTLSFLICIYEAPADLRSICLANLKSQLTNPQLREASELLMKTIGSNLEEQWMRSINLAITNWIQERQANNTTFNTPSPLFSYSLSTFELWKVHLYCPIISMDVESSNNSSTDERLLFSLKHHQLEGVIQFNYRVIIQEKWVDVLVAIDNLRYELLINQTVFSKILTWYYSLDLA